STVAGFASSAQPGVPFAGLVSVALTPVYHPGAWRAAFQVIGAIGVTWVLLWLLSVRRSDLAIEPRASPSLVGIVGWLALLLGLDIALQLAQVQYPQLKSPLMTLPLKLGVSALGITAVALWLFRSTRADGEGETLPRRDFLRRFWVVVVINVSI